MSERRPHASEACAQGQWIRAAVLRYEGPLLRYATQITGDVERGRDVVQDAFLRLCRQRPAELDGHLAQWLYTVVRNRALDVNDKEKRMRTISQGVAESQPSRESNQAAAVERNETLDRVLRFVSSLSPHQQEVVRLKFQNGLSYKEISAITEHSVSKVGYLLHSALRKLREDLPADCQPNS